MTIIQYFLDILIVAIIPYTGVKTQVAAVEQAIVDDGKKVEAPVVVVTGASRGIGRAVALTLGKAGCKVSSFLGTWFLYYKCVSLVKESAAL